MENEGKNENPVNSGISLFKILLIALLVIVVGLLFYMYQKENEVYDDDKYFDSSEENDFYYKGIPDRVEDSEESRIKESDTGSTTDYSSQSKTFEYTEDRYDAEEKHLEYFKTTLKNNLVLTRVIPSVEYKEDIIYEIANNNSESIGDFGMKVVFYDAANKIIDIDEVDIDFIEANSVAYVTSSHDETEPYARYDYVFVKDMYYNDYIGCKDAIKYEIKEDQDMEEYNVFVKNTSNYEVEEAIFFAKYFDAAGNLIHVEDKSAYFSLDDYEEDSGWFGKLSKNNNSTEEKYDDEIYFSSHLYDENDNEIPFAKCEITLYSAYRIEEV